MGNEGTNNRANDPQSDDIVLIPVKASSLPETTDATIYWAYGFVDLPDGRTDSRKFSLGGLLETISSIVDERNRIKHYSLSVTRGEPIRFWLPEEYTIQKVDGTDMLKLVIRIDGVSQETTVVFGQQMSLTIPAKTYWWIIPTPMYSDTKEINIDIIGKIKMD